MAEGDEELVDQDPEEDEEDTQEEQRGGEGCSHIVSLVQEEGEVDDEVETATDQSDDHEDVEDQPGEDEQSAASPHAKQQQEGGEETKESDGETEDEYPDVQPEPALRCELLGPGLLHGVHLEHLGLGLGLGGLEDEPGGGAEREQQVEQALGGGSTLQSVTARNTG